MDTNLSKNPIFWGICGGVVSLLFVYFDAKVNKQDTTIMSYVKVFGLVAIMIAIVAYFLIDKNIDIIKGGTKLFDQINSSKQLGGSQVDISSDVTGDDMSSNIKEFTRRVLTNAPDW